MSLFIDKMDFPLPNLEMKHGFIHHFQRNSWILGLEFVPGSSFEGFAGQSQFEQKF